VQANTFRDYYREHSGQVDEWVSEAMEMITDSSMAEVEEPEVE